MIGRLARLASEEEEEIKASKQALCVRTAEGLASWAEDDALVGASLVALGVAAGLVAVGVAASQLLVRCCSAARCRRTGGRTDERLQQGKGKEKEEDNDKLTPRDRTRMRKEKRKEENQSAESLLPKILKL